MLGALCAVIAVGREVPAGAGVFVAADVLRLAEVDDGFEIVRILHDRMLPSMHL